MLVKLPVSTLVPGQPYIAPTPEQTVCTPVEPAGEWVMSCTRYELSEGSFPVPPYELVVVRDGGGNIIDQYLQLCVSTWVPGTGGVTAPVCTTYPADPGQPYVAPTFVSTPSYAWDAGAVSIDELDDDVSMTLSGMGQAVGVVVGLTGNREDVEQFERIEHGLYFSTAPSGARQFQIMEEGRVRTPVDTYTDADAFEIRRVAGVVTYWVNDEVYYRSSLSSSGLVSVGSSFFATGDNIP